MKESIQCAFVLAICLALIPCLAFVSAGHSDTSELTVGVYFTDEGRIAVLAQMPADFAEEALKAQAVLARTYILRRYEAELDSPTPSLHGALISDDDRIYQSFFTPEQAEAFYGDGYKAARRRVQAAVREAPWILTYKDEPVTAAYHSASSGMTESALDAWGQEIPYLQAVKSESDAELEGIQTTLTVSREEFCRCVSEQLGVKVTGELSDMIKTEVNERGYVTAVYLCGAKVGAQRFISAVGIASPCFVWEVKDDSLVFTARGFGHLVGMSQYGANSMAEKGSTCSEILTHYYKGCKLYQPKQIS